MLLDHTHNPGDEWLIAQKDEGFTEEYFCLKCACPLIECPYCEALHPKSQVLRMNKSQV